MNLVRLDHRHDHEERRPRRAARRPGNPHLFYDPLGGGIEYVWLSWEGIEPNVMERLVGQQFEEADFLPAPVFARRARALDPEGRFPPS